MLCFTKPIFNKGVLKCLESRLLKQTDHTFGQSKHI